MKYKKYPKEHLAYEYEREQKENFNNQVLKKFNNSCAVKSCNSKEGNLTIHHKISPAENPLLEFDLNNVILLCRTHHDLVHNPHLFKKLKRLEKFK